MECETTNLFRQVLKGWIFFVNFRKLLNNIIEVLDYTNLFSDRFFKDEYFFGNLRKLLDNIIVVWDYTNLFSDRFLKDEYFFGNFRKLLLECETTNLYRQGLKGWIFFINFRKFLDNIIGVWYYTKLFSDRFFKDEYFFGNFRKLSEIIVGVRDDESLQTGS